MISVALLSLLGIGIYQATTRSFDVNIRLGRESTEYTAVILSLQAVESDLAQIYSPVLDPATPSGTPDGRGAAVPPQFWSNPVRPDGLRRARLNGTGERLTFINNANRRVESDSPQSDFQKVTWEIERNDSGAYSLYRSTDWDVYRYEENMSAAKPVRVALLDNLSSAKFRYYRRENKTWEDSWDSEGGFAKPESRYPDLISLKVEVPDPQNNANQQAWEIIVKPNLPLNGPPKANDQELMTE